MVTAATADGYHKDREFLNAPSSLSPLERTCRAFSKESNSRYPSSSFVSASKSYSSRISTISSSSSSPSSSTSQSLPSQLLNPLPKTLSALSQNRSHSIDSVRASPRTTARSLSVSFQGESFVFHTIKAKPTSRKPSTGPIYEGDGRFLKVRARDSNLLTKRSDPISLTVRLLLDEANFSIGDRSPPLDSDLLKGRVKSSSQTLPSRKLVPCSLSGPKSYFPRQDGVPRTNINSPENHSNDQAGNAPSIISFASEVRRRKKSESQIEDAHKLRMFHNRYLQWRYTNAIMESAFSIQMVNAKSNLYKVWVTISGLHKLSMKKKVELEALMQNWKLASMLKEQIAFLDEWFSLDNDHHSSLKGAIEALKASTLRLPVSREAKANNIQELKDTLNQTVNVMQSMSVPISYLLSKIQRMSFIISELAKAAAYGLALLDQSRDLLAIVAALHVKQCILQVSILQLKGKASLKQLQ